MHARKAGLVGGATLIGAGVLAARSLGPKMHDHCKSMQADMCRHGAVAGDERKCPPMAACGAPMNAEEVK